MKTLYFLFALALFPSLHAGDCYVDPATAHGSPDGSVSAPYASISAALADKANWADPFDTNSPNRIYLADTAANVAPSGGINLTGCSGMDNPLAIIGWDNGGTITAELGDGTTVAAGEIDGNGTNTYLFTPTGSFLTLWGLKLHGTTNYAVSLSNGFLLNCEVYGGTSRNANLITSDAWNCYFHSLSTGYAHVATSGGCRVTRCRFEGSARGIYGASGAGLFDYCVFESQTVAGVYALGRGQRIENCTFTDCAVGVLIGGTTSDNWSLLNCLFENTDPAVSNPYDAPALLLGNNALGGGSYSGTVTAALELPDVTATDPAILNNPDSDTAGRIGAVQDYGEGAAAPAVELEVTVSADGQTVTATIVESE